MRASPPHPPPQDEVHQNSTGRIPGTKASTKKRGDRKGFFKE